MSFYLPIILQKYATNPLNKNLDLNNFQIKNLANATLGSDAVNLNQVLAIVPTGSGGTLPFSLDRTSPFASLGLFTNPSGDNIQFTAPTGTGKLIFTDVHGIDFVNSPSTFTYNTTGTTIKTTNSSNGIAIEADNTGSGIGARITGNTTQSAVSVVSSSNTIGTAGILVAHSGTASGVRINNTSTGDGLFVNQTGTSTYALRVDDNSTTVQSVGITKSNNGTALDINKTTGNLNALNISNGGSGYAIQTGGAKGDVLIAGTLEQNGRIIQSTGGNQPTTSISHTSGDGDAVNITKSGVNGNALDITFNATGPDQAVLLNKSSGAGDCIRVSQSGTSGGKLLSLVNTNASNSNQGLFIQSNGSGTKLDIDNTGDGTSLNVSRTSSTTSGIGVDIVVDGSQSSSRALRAQINTGSATTCDFRNNAGGNCVFVQSSSSAGSGIEILHQANNSSHAMVIRKEGTGSGSALDIRNTSSGDSLRVADELATDNSMFRIDADGNVGIGVGSTATLTNKVEINDSGTNIGLRINKSTNGAGLSINKSGGSGEAIAIQKSGGNDAALYIENFTVGDCIRVADTSSDTTLFRVDEDGRVGIGVSGGALTSRFESIGASGSDSTLINQGTGFIELRTTGSLGSSRVILDTTRTNIIGRSDVFIEPSIATASVSSTTRARLTTTGNNTFLIQGYTGSGGTEFRFGFCDTASTSSAMNVYTNSNTRRVVIGNTDVGNAPPSSVLEINRNNTPHGTTIPHLVLSGTNASGGDVMNCNAGRIANAGAPTTANDVITASFTSYTSTNGSKSAITDYSKPFMYSRAITSFINTASFTYNSGGANPLSSTYYLIAETTNTNPMGTSPTSSVIENAPCTFSMNASGANFYGVWRLRKAGFYKIDLVCAPTLAITASLGYRLRVYQDSNTVPTTLRTDVPNMIPSQTTANLEYPVSRTFILSQANGEYFTFASSTVPSNTPTFGSDGRLTVLVEYLGVAYA